MIIIYLRYISGFSMKCIWNSITIFGFRMFSGSPFRNSSAILDGGNICRIEQLQHFLTTSRETFLVTCYAVVQEKKSKMFQLIRDQGSYLAFDSHQIVTTFLQNLNKGTFLANLVPLHAVVVEKKYKMSQPIRGRWLSWKSSVLKSNNDTSWPLTPKGTIVLSLMTGIGMQWSEEVVNVKSFRLMDVRHFSVRRAHLSFWQR